MWLLGFNYRKINLWNPLLKLLKTVIFIGNDQNWKWWNEKAFIVYWGHNDLGGTMIDEWDN